jgi:hypothetical protein
MASFKPLSAKNAKVRIAATVFTGAEWTVTPIAIDFDVSNFESGVGGIGYTDVETGLLDCAFEVSGLWDGNNNPFDAPLSLVPGTTQTNSLYLYINDTTGPFYKFITWKVLTAPTGARVREGVSFKFTGRNKGQFLTPTGAA